MKTYKPSDFKEAVLPPRSSVSPRRPVVGPLVGSDVDKKSRKKLEFSSELDESDDDEPSEGITRFLSSKNDLPYVLRDAYKDSELKTYKVDAFVLSQKDVINAMNEAVESGDSVDLSVGGHHQNKMDQYKVTTVRRDKNMHGKNIVGLDISPSKGEPKKALFITGSANPTDAIWPTGNIESVVEVKGDIALAKKAYKLMRSDSLVTDKEIVQSTPTKRDVYSSRKTALNKSRAERVLTVAHDTGDDRIAWASTMNINDQDMSNALCDAAKSGADTRLIVHKTALTRNGLPLLNKMAEAGVQVFVFYPSDDSRKIQHKKELIRKDLYITSNANFTDEGDSQQNLETYFPDDKQLIESAKKDFERVQADCVPLEKARELFEVTRAKAAEKKKAKAAQKKEAEEKKILDKKRKKMSEGRAVKQPSSKKRKANDNKK